MKPQIKPRRILDRKYQRSVMQNEECVSKSHIYVAYGDCGCVVGIIVDELDYPKDTAKSVAEFICGGCSVNRMPMAEYRQITAFGHKCGKEKKR